MLDDRHSRPGNDERRRGADVEGAGAVASGPAGIEHGPSRIPANHVLTQHLGGRRDLAGRLALHAQTGKKRRSLRLAALPSHHLAQYMTDLFRSQLLAANERVQDFGNGIWGSHARLTIAISRENCKSPLFLCTNV